MPRFEIRRFDVQGNTLLTQAQVQALLAPYVGAQRDFSDIARAVEALEGAYRARGYSAVQVQLPEQELERGVVRLSVLQTPLGKLGLYACMDGVVSETPRCLALRGAEILCNSLNSFATDEGSLHIPVRAAESRVFVVAANKIGPLIPEAILEPVSAATGIPIRFLSGAGDSQIVAPDGTVLALASPDKAEVIWADIDVSEARSKQRPDGTQVFAARITL